VRESMIRLLSGLRPRPPEAFLKTHFFDGNEVQSRKRARRVQRTLGLGNASLPRIGFAPIASWAQDGPQPPREDRCRAWEARGREDGGGGQDLEVVDAWKKTTEQHVQRTPKAELSVLVAKLQETEAWRIKALDRYEAVLGDLEEDKWPDDSYFEQPPSHEQMLCDGSLVFDLNFGQLLPNERAHYGLHGLPHEQAAGFGQNTTAAGVSQDRISQQPPLHQAAGFVLPTAVEGVLGQLWAWDLPYFWPTTTAADDSFEPRHSHQREAVFVQQHPAHEQAECFGAQIGGQRTAAPSGSIRSRRTLGGSRR